MSSACSAPGLPAWEERVRRALELGDYDWLITTPRVARILAGLGARNLRVPRGPGVDLGCCGRRLVQVNGGGLYSEGEWSPNTLQSYRVEPLIFSPYSDPAGCGNDAIKGLASPLGWPNYTPLIATSAPECPEIGGRSVVPARLEPLINTGLTAACRPEPAHTKPGLAPFRVPGSRLLSSRNGLRVEEAGGSSLITMEATGGVLALGGSLTLETPYYESTVSILGPGTFFALRGTNVEGEANAVSVGGALGSIALASAGGMKFSVEPGRISIEYNGSLRIIRGGPLVAARLLHEDAVTVRAGDACGRGFGHLRVSGHVALVTSASRRGLAISVYSPIADGRGEARLFFPVRMATWRGLGEEPVEIPVAGDLVRWPAPFGACGRIDLEIGGSLFLRLRGRGEGSRR